MRIKRGRHNLHATFKNRRDPRRDPRVKQVTMLGAQVMFAFWRLAEIRIDLGMYVVKIGYWSTDFRWEGE